MRKIQVAAWLMPACLVVCIELFLEVVKKIGSAAMTVLLKTVVVDPRYRAVKTDT